MVVVEECFIFNFDPVTRPSLSSSSSSVVSISAPADFVVVFASSAAEILLYCFAIEYYLQLFSLARDSLPSSLATPAKLVYNRCKIEYYISFNNISRHLKTLHSTLYSI